MQIQKSFAANNSKGCLYLVPTPIGNLEDMTFRAVRILKEVDYIAAEDTRNTKKLTNHFAISTNIVSYHEHNKELSGRKLIDKLLEGKNIALVSDAGTPTISDPGYELVQMAINEGIHVVPLPGANAAITALIASGLIPQPFYYYGFLPRKKKEKKEEIERLRSLSSTIILYEAPHRLKETLHLLLAGLGERQMTLCREITKKYEEFLRGTIKEMLEWTEQEEVRGEFVLIIEGLKDEIEQGEQWWSSLTIVEHINHYIHVKGLSSKEAIKQTAKDRGLNKREVYQAYHSD